MDSTSVSTFVASFAFQEIDFFVMIVMAAFIGWRIADAVRRHYKKLSKSKASKSSQKNKASEDETAVPQQKYSADFAQLKRRGDCRLPPTQTLAARAAVPKTAGLEQPIPEIRAPCGLQHPPGLELPPGLAAPKAPVMPASQGVPWRSKASASTTPLALLEDNAERELGRVVCWKETGYGFVVDEAGTRLFVRQAEVEGGELLRAGQLIRFRRGKARAGQAAKAVNVTLVSQEEARVMRKSAPRNKALAESPTKAANKALAFPSTLKKEVVVVPPPTKAPAMQKSSDDANDDDLCAFLGAGSKEEQIENLKYAPQWVADKFCSQQAQQKEQ